jgi:hypothetical protein
MTIKEIKKYYEFRGMKMPNSKEALDFAITEIGEAMDAWIRENSGDWVRNNPDKDANFAFELADTYQMLQIASILHNGATLEENLRAKWESKGFQA